MWKKGNRTLKIEDWKEWDPNFDYQRKRMKEKHDGN